MAPACKPGSGRDEGDFYAIKEDRKTRKPLIEKKRRARINESLQELRLILADTELQSKMENAEVLEMTVKRVQNILCNRNIGVKIHSFIQRTGRSGNFTRSRVRSH